jgi:hypothetical protein
MIFCYFKRENRNDKTYFILISVPFRNLYSAFRSAQWIKTILKLKLQWEAVSSQITFSSDERVFEFSIT